MYIHIALFTVAALVTVAAAAPSTLRAHDTECKTGPIQCCVNTYTTTDITVTEVTGLLRIVLPTIEGLVGLGCTPTRVVGTGSGAVCTQQPVCCTDNTYGGLINLGCSPVNINLQRISGWPNGARFVSAALDVSSFFPYWFE